MFSGRQVLTALRRSIGMSGSFLATLAVSAVALSVRASWRPAAPSHGDSGTEDRVSFRRSQDIVTDIDLHVAASTTRCGSSARADSATSGSRPQKSTHLEKRKKRRLDPSPLIFDMGNEQDRRFGELPRVQLGFYRRRLTLMLVTTMTGEQWGFVEALSERAGRTCDVQRHAGTPGARSGRTRSTTA